MRYIEYRDAIQAALSRRSSGMTWPQLQEKLAPPYDRPCPTWTRQLEKEIGLSRVKGKGRALVWRIGT
jgi:hypothetical protein